MCCHKLMVALVVVSTVWSASSSKRALGFDDRPECTLQPVPSRKGQHPPVITALAFHATGRWLAAAGDDHVVRVWDTDAREVVASTRIHKDWVHGVCLPDGGDVVASVSADGQVVEWNWRTDQHRTLLSVPQSLWAIAATPDGQRLVAAGYNSPIYIIDRHAGRVESTVRHACRDIRALAVTADGSLVGAGGCNGNLLIISTASGRVLRAFPAHGRAIRAVAFDTTGTRIICGGDDRSLCLWDLGDGKEVMHLQSGTARTRALCVLDKDRVATAGSDNLIRIWDLRLGTEITRLEGHAGTIAALAAHESRLASGGFDAIVRLWELPGESHWQTAHQQETTER